jgi:hypothetical protein
MENDLAYTESIQQQREARELEMMKNPLNWFSLVGLFPLQEGDNLLGAGDKYRINIKGLPAGETANLIVRTEGVFLTTPSSGFTSNALPPEVRPLRQDVEGSPDLIEVGTIAMQVIRRGTTSYLRVWDRDAAGIRGFSGYKYFPVEPFYCVKADFVAYNPPRLIPIQDVLGNESERTFPGLVRFSLHGVACSLVAEDTGDELLFSFTDLTRADATYPGGRYLATPQPKNGVVTLDFNLAVNWPCAYTAYATCPLPPLENHLGIRIEAGEKRYSI